MPSRTHIQWSDYTWNTWIGCSKVSPGCSHCYAIPTSERNARLGMRHYEGVTARDAKGQPQWTGKLGMASQATLEKPLTVKAPSLWFVNSMSDFWHENATADMRRRVFEVIDRCPQHRFQVLTKRPERIADCMKELGRQLPRNVWLGVTAEDQIRADLRVPFLDYFDTPEVRFASVEPMLSPVSLRGLSDSIDWVIIGGESGPGARPMEARWVGQLLEELAKMNVAGFFKQWGHWKNNPLAAEGAIDFRGPAGTVEHWDPGAKGGCRIRGQQVKEFPAGWRRAA